MAQSSSEKICGGGDVGDEANHNGGNVYTHALVWRQSPSDYGVIFDLVMASVQHCQCGSEASRGRSINVEKFENIYADIYHICMGTGQSGDVALLIWMAR